MSTNTTPKKIPHDQVITISGFEHDVHFMPDGSVKIGCQTLSGHSEQGDCIKLTRLLGDSGYVRSKTAASCLDPLVKFIRDNRQAPPKPISELPPGTRIADVDGYEFIIMNKSSTSRGMNRLIEDSSRLVWAFNLSAHIPWLFDPEDTNYTIISESHQESSK